MRKIGPKEKYLVQKKTEKYTAFWRLVCFAFLIALVLIDAPNEQFEFPPVCYILIVCIVIGLDGPTIVKMVVKK